VLSFDPATRLLTLMEAPGVPEYPLVGLRGITDCLPQAFWEVEKHGKKVEAVFMHPATVAFILRTTEKVIIPTGLTNDTFDPKFEAWVLSEAHLVCSQHVPEDCLYLCVGQEDEDDPIDIEKGTLCMMVTV